MIDLKKTILEKKPGFNEMPGADLIYKVLKLLIRQDEINEFIESHQHLQGFAFLDRVLSYFNFSYQVSSASLKNIPAEGRLIIVANHPIGSLDGLALLKLLHSIRPDIRIVANELLSQVKPLQSLFLPVETFARQSHYRQQYKAMLDALQKEEALIIFPAGEVSRIKPTGVKDGQWKAGFLKLAKKTAAPVLPVLVEGKNSALFYGLSSIYKPLGSAMLVHEMFNKKDQKLVFHVGKVVPVQNLFQGSQNLPELAQKFRKHLYRLSKPKKKALFETVETIAHPARTRDLKKELYQSELLGETEDGKKIFLCDKKPGSVVLHEIGRLRELTFRTVQEGTGSAMDIDRFDHYYRHIVLWDENDLEIVGAYRLAECKQVLAEKGVEGLYTHTLFHFYPRFINKLDQAIELGRSFVQPKYWGKRSLDYLWYGIGAYLRNYPEVRYLFGPVSLSQSYSMQSKEMILAFYRQQFAAGEVWVEARRPFEISQYAQKIAQKMYTDDYKSSYKKLNKQLKELGVKVPALYKQYAELCKPDGCFFLDFNIDPDFSDCIDSLVFVDLHKIKAKKKARYLQDNTLTGVILKKAS